ncbi:MAG: ligand-gated channel [Alphaproteobacteria bacterium]|nr:MAG: ligand-gated channel [Alphaproteobacteria bacterium]
MEEVVVTARRREESAQDVPVSVTAYSAARIDRQDLTSLEKLAAFTPQFSVGRASNGSGAQLTMRGIGSSSTSIGIEQSVAVIVDGVYFGQGRTINEGFFDLGSVEVMKGPQALFFGKNATAGAISINTANPTKEFEGMARVGYEVNAGQLIGEVIGSGPLTEDLGLRIAVRGANMFGGLFHNDAQVRQVGFFDVATLTGSTLDTTVGERGLPGEKEFVGRVTLQWQPSDRLNVNLKLTGDSNKNDNPSYNSVPFACPTPNTTFDPSVPCAKRFRIDQSGMPLEVAQSGLPFAKDDGSLFNHYRSWAVTGKVEYQLDQVAITSVTNYQWNRNTFGLKGDFQTTSNPAIGNVWATENTSWRSVSTELRALTKFDGPLNMLIGGLYQNTERDFAQWVQTAGLEDSSAANPADRFNVFSKDSKTDGETFSAYGQAILNPTDSIEITGGVRFTRETKDSDFRHPFVNPALAAIFIPFDPNNAAATQITADQKFTNWSPDATISWTPVDDVMIYGAYKEGFKSGGFSNSAILSGFSATPLEDFTFAPEKASGFEGGVKSTVLDNQLRLNVGLYTYKFSNLQVDFFNSPIFAFQTVNAGSARTKGVEIEFQYAPFALAGFQLHGALNYNRARYNDFLAPCYAGQTIAEGCTLLGPSGAPFQDLSGQPTSVAPEWTGLLGFGYDRPLGDTFVAGVTLDARYSDDYLASGFGNPLSKQNEYVAINASLQIGREDERWQLAVIGKNLTNRFYVTGVVDGPSTGSGTGTASGVKADQVGFAANPRTVEFRLTTRF